MSGWQQQVSMDEHPFIHVPPKGVIGIVVAQKFPDPQAIRTTLEDGLARVSPETVWVMREAERKGHAVGYAWQTFKAHGIEPLLAPLTPVWKGDEYDLRASWRDLEMRATCERIIVFHDKSSNITAEWLEYRTNHLSTAKVFAVERGNVKVKRHRKGRNMQT